MKLKQALQRWLIAATFLVVMGSVPSDLPAASKDLSEALAIQQLQQQAKKLEAQGQWATALQLYDQLPARDRHLTEITDSFRNCLRRVQQLRRHQDPTYRDQIHTVPWHDGLEVYAEVLATLQINYVDREKIGLARLFHQGLEELRLALDDQAFCEAYLPGATLEAVRTFQAELEADWGSRRIEGIRDAQGLVQMVAWSAEEKLGLRKTAVVFEFICGACSGLDEYTYYLTPGELAELTASWEGKLVGVGVEVATQGPKLVVSQVVPASPAYAEGLKVDDQITRIGTQSTSSMSAETAMELLKGKVDTTVDLEVATDGMPLRVVQLKRRVVAVPSVSEPRFVDERQDIGYVQLIAFQETTLAELDIAIARLQAAGMKVLILDLRGNPGGPFEVAVRVVERFLASGVIVTTHGRIGGQVRDYNKTYEAHRADALPVPLVVLVDAETASSAEMVAGALKDNQRGMLIGQTTFGKGSIQRVDKLRTAPLAGIRMTVAKFYSPSGRPYTDTGITPDVVIRPETSMEIGQDTQLQAAVDIARPLTIAR